LETPLTENTINEADKLVLLANLATWFFRDENL